MPIGESKVLFQGRRFRVERQVQVGPDGREHVWDFVPPPGGGRHSAAVG